MRACCRKVRINKFSTKYGWNVTKNTIFGATILFMYNCTVMAKKCETVTITILLLFLFKLYWSCQHFWVNYFCFLLQYFWQCLAHMPLLLAKFNSSCLCLKLLWIYFSFWIFSRNRLYIIQSFFDLFDHRWSPKITVLTLFLIMIILLRSYLFCRDWHKIEYLPLAMIACIVNFSFIIIIHLGM